MNAGVPNVGLASCGAEELIRETSFPATSIRLPQFAVEITGVLFEVDNAEDGDTFSQTTMWRCGSCKGWQ